MFACFQFLWETDVCLVFLVCTVRAGHRWMNLSCGPLGGLELPVTRNSEAFSLLGGAGSVKWADIRMQDRPH